MGYRYNWQEGSPIRQIEVKKSAAGWLQVVIYAPPTTTDKLLSLPNYLAKNDITCYLDEVDDKSVIKVADIGKKDDEFLDLLKNGGFLSGPISKTQIPDEAIKLGMLGLIRKYSLNVSGLFGEVGHAALITQGILNKNRNNVTTGLLYGASTALPAVFGSGAGAIRFSQIADGLRDYLNKEGIKLADPLIETPQIKFRDRTVITQFWDFIKSHPVQTQNVISFPGNVLLALSGIEEVRATKGKSGMGYIVSGILAGIGAIIAIVVPEATPEKLDEFKKKKGFRQTLKEDGFIAAVKTLPDVIYMGLARKPMVFYGGLLAIENVFGIDREALDAWRNYKDPSRNPAGPVTKRDLFLKFTQAGGWSLSSLTGTLGSKKRDKSLETKEAYDGLYAQTANLLLGVPENAQKDIIKKAAEFLAAEPDVHVRSAEIEKELTDKMNILKKNPWKSHVVDIEQVAAGQKASVVTKLDRMEAHSSDVPAPGMSKTAPPHLKPLEAAISTNGQMSFPDTSLNSVTAAPSVEQQQALSHPVG